MYQGKIFPFLHPKTRGNEFQKLAIWGTIFVDEKRHQIASPGHRILKNDFLIKGRDFLINISPIPFFVEKVQ